MSNYIPEDKNTETNWYNIDITTSNILINLYDTVSLLIKGIVLWAIIYSLKAKYESIPAEIKIQEEKENEVKETKNNNGKFNFVIL